MLTLCDILNNIDEEWVDCKNRHQRAREIQRQISEILETESSHLYSDDD
jgi:hypothetical protein